MSKTLKPVAARPPEYVGRDEMNLAEFPLSLLSERSSAGAMTFSRERTLVLADGSKLHQSWLVTGSPEFGLPQPGDEDVLLGLLKIASDNGFESPTVHFTQMALLNVVQWRNQGFYFKRLEQALARLKTTSILATNAFWNNTTKTYQTRHFGIIDSYELWERRQGTGCAKLFALSSNWARLSTEFFSSIQAGYIKPLDLKVYFALQSSIAKRLYRFLDKKGYRKEQFSINLQQLATVHLGLGDSTCRYVSWIKRELDRAHRELVALDFLESATYGVTKSGDPKVTYAFSTRTSSTEQLALPEPADSTTRLLQMLVDRGVSVTTARELVRESKPDALLERIDVFDHLRLMSRHKPLQNPAGFLVQSIRNQWTMVPPGYTPMAVRREQAHKEEQRRRVTTEQAARQTEEAKTLQMLRESLPEETMKALREEAFEQARQQIGTAYRVRPDSRLVDAFLNGILKERYAS